MKEKYMQIHETSFLGSPIQGDKTYHVIGAGIAGLLCGFYLEKAGIPFKIIEKTNRAGGILGTESLRYGIAEQAANGFLWCAALQEVCDDLNLEIISPQKVAKARYFVRKRKLRQYPFSIIETFGIARRMLTPYRASIHTMEDFGQAYFGDAFTRQLLEPAMGGIYGAPLKDMSFPAVMGTLAGHLEERPFLPNALRRWSRERKKSKTQKPDNMRGTQSFEGGMQTLIHRLAEYLDDHILYGTAADPTYIQNKNEQYIITAPAYTAAHFFGNTLKNLLTQIRYTPIISTTLFFRKKDIRKFKEGFGCLIPRNEGLTILGVLFNSCIFPHRVTDESVVSLTCIMRDDSADLALMQGADIDVKNLVVRELDVLFDIQGDLLDYGIFRWEKGIPVYSPELHDSLFEVHRILNEQYPHINLFGNYTGAISIRAMSEEIRKIFLP